MSYFPKGEIPASLFCCFCCSRKALKGSAPTGFKLVELLGVLADGLARGMGDKLFFSICALKGSTPGVGAGAVGEPFDLDSVRFGFDSIWGAGGVVFVSPNHPENVGCKSQIRANATIMIRASFPCENCFILRLTVKFFQKTKSHPLESPTRSMRF